MRRDAATGSSRAPALPVLGAAAGAVLVGLALLAALAPGYLTERGFPLDDAWIHAVYGRELARSGTLAYNPGIPATGATSLLWAALLAVLHRAAGGGPALVLATKLLGAALLAAAAFVGARAAGGARGAAIAGAALVGLAPPLLAASVSGMEVSLTALAAAALLLAAQGESAVWYGAVAAVAPLARPELAALALLAPALAAVGPGGARRALRRWGAAAVGLGVTLGLVAWRNVAVTGRPFPATYYAKVAVSHRWIAGDLARGFERLLGQLPLTPAPLVAVGSALALVALVARSGAARAAAAVWLAGLFLCALSFVLVPPLDPFAFYHQRYALPGVALLLAAAPALVARVVARLPSQRARRLAAAALAVPAAASLLLDAPARLRHLQNDARNIDDVQVAVGRALAGARPTDRVWAVDAGGVRYFGAAFVVDTLGLNTPELLGAGAAAYLAAHPPTWLEGVPGWSELSGTDAARLPASRFAPSGAYTVTSFPAMQLHVLHRCEPGARGVFSIRGRAFPFACAAP